MVEFGATVRAGLYDNGGNLKAGSPAADVAVGARDETSTFDATAAVVEGALAISGAVDLGVVRNETAAEVESGALIEASRDVDIAALSSETVDSFVGGLGLTTGGVELNVSLSLYSIGAVLPNDILDPLSAIGGPGQFESYLDGLLSHIVDPQANGLVGDLNDYAQGVGGQQAAATDLASETPSDPVANELGATSDPSAGTIATVTGAKIIAQRNVDVGANDGVTADLDTSYTFSITLGGGSQNLNLSLDGGLLAARANASAMISSNCVISAGAGDIDVTGNANTTETVASTVAFNDSTGNASAIVDSSNLSAGGQVDDTAEMDATNKFSGILPGFSGLKYRVAENTEANTINAAIQDGSSVVAGNAVIVSAVSNSSVNVKADGATLFDDGFAGNFTLGAAVADNTLDNTVAATIGDSSVLTKIVSVTATADVSDFTLALGVADGDQAALSVGGSVADNIFNDKVSATIEGSLVIAPGNVDVLATDTAGMGAITGGAVFRDKLGLGGAVSYARTNDDVKAEIGDSTVEAADGHVRVIATGDAEMQALALALAQGSNAALEASFTDDEADMTIASQVVDGSAITAGGEVDVEATGDGSIELASGGRRVHRQRICRRRGSVMEQHRRACHRQRRSERDNRGRTR